jgi:AraC family transcriptional regulator of arabinose operon
MEPRIQRVVLLMTDELRRDVSIKELAQSVNLSSSRLRHLFKDETGLSIKQYLKAQRMQKAKELLESTFLSIKEIMPRIGIKDKSHFTRAFKKLYGLSPAKYRSQYWSHLRDSGQDFRSKLQLANSANK